MKKMILFWMLVFSMISRSFAGNPPDEGMWLPMLVQRLNYVDMQKAGLHLTSEEIYSINNSSMKDAIVSLGFFCTAEVVSNEGLILTNHHCGYESVQTHSSVEHDYLTNGFWAKAKNEELPNKGLTATFLIRMEDVTEKVLSAVNEQMEESKRNEIIEKVSASLETEASENGKYEVQVKSFFEGNEFYMFVYETYKDVRLVGTPPSAVGKFGGDTDNWMWPRHTGDFCLFRIYTAPDGSPAEYNENNIPLVPKYSLPISLKGVKKDDFTMIWGYPGNTDRYLTSFGVNLAIEQSNPAVVKIRDKKLAIIKEFMNKDSRVRIQYASKYANCSNYWKYYIGQTRGLKKLDVVNKKQVIEAAFTKWVNEDDQRKVKYGTVLSDIETGYENLKQHNLLLKYLEEAAFQGPELIFFSYGAFPVLKALKNVKNDKESLGAATAEFKESSLEYFKNYNKLCDKKLFSNLLQMFYQDIPKDQLPSVFSEVIEKKFRNNFDKYADVVYNKSILVDSSKLFTFLKKPNIKTLQNDPGFKIMQSMIKSYFETYQDVRSAEEKISKGNRLFVQGLRLMNPDKVFYPNANSTMRMTYGKVGDYYPADAVYYNYKTTLDGIFEKEDSTNEEFIVPKKLKELWEKKDYGIYGENGKLITCFITNTDITGGNSGSPVINGDGQLIGIAFDGNWEAMSGDIAYEPELQRTICVDIRYVLFMIDKYAGATNLIREMTIVH